MYIGHAVCIAVNQPTWLVLFTLNFRPWSALSGPFVTLLSQIGTETIPSLL